MNVITRGIRNVFRNGIRTFSIIVILGISVGLAISMLVARQAVQSKIESVKSSIGNTITISPAGTRGFEGGGEPLTNAQLDKVSSLVNVSSVVRILSDRLTTSNTSLVSAVEAGSLGKRQAQNSGIEMSPPSGGGQFGGSSSSSSEGERSFTPPVTVTGTSDPSSSVSFSGSAVSISSGTVFDSASASNVAILGAGIAEKNSLSVGSTFTAYDQEVTVVAIYDAGNDFSNNGVVMPIATLQKLSDQSGSITSATVVVDSIDNVDSVVTSVESALGDSADVVSQKDTATQAVEPLENIKNITLFSLLCAVVAGATIILLTMIMIVRERRREIGVLKAIGASNLRVMVQFMSESVTLTMLGAVVGAVIGIAAANPLTQLLVTSSSNTSGGNGMSGAGGPGKMGASVVSGGLNLQGINATIGWDILLYGLLAALFIAIVGSAAASWLIGKIRPAEVMRAE
ncbi:MAG: FtsX-like permease family protein [Candidatus Woesebacteria bacterium]